MEWVSRKSVWMVICALISAQALGEGSEVSVAGSVETIGPSSAEVAMNPASIEASTMCFANITCAVLVTGTVGVTVTALIVMHYREDRARMRRDYRAGASDAQLYLAQKGPKTPLMDRLGQIELQAIQTISDPSLSQARQLNERAIASLIIQRSAFLEANP